MFNEIKVQYENVLNKSGFKCKLKYVNINNNINNNNNNNNSNNNNSFVDFQIDIL